MAHQGDGTTRVHLAALALLLPLIVFMIAAVERQAINAESHFQNSQLSYQREARLAARRGSIVDRDGTELALSLLAPTLGFSPRNFLASELPADDPESRARRIREVRLLVEALRPERLSDFDRWVSSTLSREEAERALPIVLRALDQLPLRLGMSGAALLEAAELGEEQERAPSYMVLAKHCDPDEAQAAVRRIRKVGVGSVWLDVDYVRDYPWGDLAGTMLGFVTPTNGAISGVELAFNDALEGEDVVYPRVGIGRGSQFVFDRVDQSPVRGHRVVLSIDSRLQRYAQDALAETIEEYQAEQGSVVVSDPSTGEILAAASWPPFDPNDGTVGRDVRFSDPVVANAYEPGSIAKIFSIAAAIDSGVVGYDTVIDLEGGAMRVPGGSTIRDVHVMESAPVWEILQQSSNIGSYKIGQMMDDERFRSYLAGFGFGQRPGLGYGGEAAGALPATPWREVEHGTRAYGYGYSASSMQLNIATAVIANGGVRMRPRVVLGLADEEGDFISQTHAEEVTRVISERSAATVTRALRTLVHPGGSVPRAHIEGVNVAGKTGTARYYDPELRAYDGYVSSFSGFLPAEDPRFVVTVQVLRPNIEIGYYGGRVAAPLFRQVASYALSLRGMLPDVAVEALAEETEIESQTLEESEIPTLVGLSLVQALERAARQGIELRFEGQGPAIASQGDSLEQGDSGARTLRVELGEF